MYTSHPEAIDLGSSSLSFTPSSSQIRRLRLVCQPTDGGDDVNGGILNHDGCVNTCHWTQDGALLLTGSDDRCVKIWDSNGR